jgi:hypothetical protein
MLRCLAEAPHRSSKGAEARRCTQLGDRKINGSYADDEARLEGFANCDVCSPTRKHRSQPYVHALSIWRPGRGILVVGKRCHVVGWGGWSGRLKISAADAAAHVLRQMVVRLTSQLPRLLEMQSAFRRLIASDRRRGGRLALLGAYFKE